MRAVSAETGPRRYGKGQGWVLPAYMRQPDCRSSSTGVQTSTCLQLIAILWLTCLTRPQQHNRTGEAKLARHWREKLLSSYAQLVQPATGLQDS